MEGAGNAYTVVVLGGVGAGVVAAVADVVVVGGGVEDGAEPVADGVEGAVVPHKDEAWVGVSDHNQDQVGDSASSPASGLVVMLSRPGSGDFEQESVEEAERRNRYIRSVEGRNVVKALEEEDMYNDAHTTHTPEY